MSAGGEPTDGWRLPVAYDRSGRIFGEAELTELAEVLAAGALTRWGGEKADAFEREWAARLGVPYAVAVSSGSAALHVALAVLDLPPGTEVITSPVTDMGTVIGIVCAGLVPVFADVDPATGLVTPETVAACLGPRTRAVLPVHLHGRCADAAGLARLADRHGLALVEDASQAHFARRAGVAAGTTGVFGCFSLQQSKVVSCGEGGVLVTADRQLAEQARIFQNKGWLRGESGAQAYPLLGVNYRMGELAAAVARAQLHRVETILQRRRASYAVVAGCLRDDPDVRVLGERPDEYASWWCLAIQCDWLPDLATARRLMSALHAEGLPFALGGIGPDPIYRVEAIRGKRTPGGARLPWSLPGAADHDYDALHHPGAQWFLTHTLTLNWNEGITVSDAERVADGIRRAVAAVRVTPEHQERHVR
ncbi:DegT/DnrJ/EryC1/StrS family aminotransferase [Solwaraspora sp. WMMB335]|uniref:DegT/DnrJ/EryC1/StrS family aminotransferase n=1 Tax=Solwaraspora sp. WMMB335 TaxID=3404118 RepID=UPI003B933BC6